MTAVTYSTDQTTTGMAVVTYDAVITASNAGNAIEVPDQWGAFASVQLEGLSAGSCALQGSNDGTTYYTLKDTSGNSISASADGVYDFSTACRYVKILNTSLSTDNLTPTFVFRG